MTKLNQGKIVDVIESLLMNFEVVTWSDIVTNVNAAKITVKNWIDVRTVLKVAFLDYNDAIRTSDLNVEHYKSNIYEVK